VFQKIDKSTYHVILRRVRVTVFAMETQQYTLFYCCWLRCNCQQYKYISVATVRVPLHCCQSNKYSILLLTIISPRHECVCILAVVIRQADRILYAPHYVAICAPCDCAIFCRVISLTAVLFPKTKY